MHSFLFLQAAVLLHGLGMLEGLHLLRFFVQSHSVSSQCTHALQGSTHILVLQHTSSSPPPLSSTHLRIDPRTRTALAAAVGTCHVAEASAWTLSPAPPPDGLLWSQLGLRSWQVGARKAVVRAGGCIGVNIPVSSLASCIKVWSACLHVAQVLAGGGTQGRGARRWVLCNVSASLHVGDA
jgi:hypothetical protein